MFPCVNEGSCEARWLWEGQEEANLLDRSRLLPGAIQGDEGEEGRQKEISGLDGFRRVEGGRVGSNNHRNRSLCP